MKKNAFLSMQHDDDDDGVYIVLGEKFPTFVFSHRDFNIMILERWWLNFFASLHFSLLSFMTLDFGLHHGHGMTV